MLKGDFECNGDFATVIGGIPVVASLHHHWLLRLSADRTFSLLFANL
jgi:hypothetical protein